MYKVLIIEDEIPLQKILANEFSRAGFEVETAGDGKEGIVKATAFIPDFILLDIIMPVMDGVTTLKYLKGSPKLKSVPVAILSALTETVPESLHPEVNVKANVVAYFRKDTEKMSEIVNKVKNYLSEA